MSTKKITTITQERMNQMIATRLGLDTQLIQDVMNVEAKIIHDNLKRGHIIERQHLFSIIPKHRKGYTFTSGLDGKKYHVEDKYDLVIDLTERVQEIVENQSKFLSYINKKKS